jgi:hypothetical protein
MLLPILRQIEQKALVDQACFRPAALCRPDHAVPFCGGASDLDAILDVPECSPVLVLRVTSGAQNGWSPSRRAIKQSGSIVKRGWHGPKMPARSFTPKIPHQLLPPPLGHALLEHRGVLVAPHGRHTQSFWYSQTGWAALLPRFSSWRLFGGF